MEQVSEIPYTCFVSNMEHNYTLNYKNVPVKNDLQGGPGMLSRGEREYRNAINFSMIGIAKTRKTMRAWGKYGDMISLTSMVTAEGCSSWRGNAWG